MELLYRTEACLAEITGMKRVTFSRRGRTELTGMMLIHAYHKSRMTSAKSPYSRLGARDQPASAAMAGYEIKRFLQTGAVWWT